MRAGDEMGCMEDVAEQQEKVREMMLWSWKGYRRGTNTCRHPSFDFQALAAIL
jgi:hypothetical protein